MRRLLSGLFLGSLSLASIACDTKTPASSVEACPVPAHCTAGTIDCADGGTAYVCAAGFDPEFGHIRLTCSTPTADPDGHDYDYCCGYRRGAICQQDDSVKCQSSDSYGYQCEKAYSPSSLLGCSSPTPDQDGIHDDYCCVHTVQTCLSDGALSSACPGSLPSGYQCTGPNDPTSYDPSVQCCPGALDPDGIHADYCCSH
jgi:hypothetical protein